MATPGVLKQLASALAVSAARQRPGHLREKSFMLRCRFTSVAIILAAPFVLGIGVAFSQVANSQTAKPELTWAPCGDIPDTECAGLPVPIDYARPGDGTMTLRLPRAPSVDAAKRGSVLLLLPGGPGVGIERWWRLHSWRVRRARRTHLLRPTRR